MPATKFFVFVFSVEKRQIISENNQNYCFLILTMWWYENALWWHHHPLGPTSSCTSYSNWLESTVQWAIKSSEKEIVGKCYKMARLAIWVNHIARHYKRIRWSRRWLLRCIKSCHRMAIGKCQNQRELRNGTVCTLN